MDLNHRRLTFSGALLLSLPLLYGQAVYAAKPVDLRHQPVSSLTSISTNAKSNLALKEIGRHVDFKKTLHVRVQQTYLGYDVMGADAIVHIPNGAKSEKFSDVVHSANGSMNGIVFQNINTDLAGTP